MMKSNHGNEEVQRVVLAFFDDTDFRTKGLASGSKIQETLN